MCCHIRQFYPGVAGEPPIFWEFDEYELPEGYRLVATPSASGDDCHRNIQDVTDDQLRKLFKTAALEDLQVCDGHDSRHLTHDDVVAFS